MELRTINFEQLIDARNGATKASDPINLDFSKESTKYQCVDFSPNVGLI